MNKTRVTIMGITVRINYTIHEPSYVEWALQDQSSVKDGELELLNVLLRTHYTGFIEAACREDAHYQSYAAASVADDWADNLRYAMYIQDVFNDSKDKSPF